MSLQPVFILSLPRSGSTLLQRVLATHPAISTASEPWLLLPLFYARRADGSTSEYHQTDSAAAINDFIDTLGSEQDYYQAVAEFALSLYRSSAGQDAAYFLDKTPRYHLIIPELIQTFPEAKFIFLWRNPLAVAASMMSTWSGGNWNLHRFEIDLYEGIENLVSASKQLGDNCFSLNFEQLVSDPDAVYPKLFEFLGLSSDAANYSSFSEVKLDGRMGDPTGIHRYQKIESATRDNWRGLFNNPVRRRWAQKYLDWVGADRLRYMGYDRKELESSITNGPASLRRLFTDTGRIIFRKVMPTPEQKELYRRRALKQ